MSKQELSPEERDALRAALPEEWKDEFAATDEIIWLAARDYWLERAAKECEDVDLACAIAIRALKGTPQ